MTRHLARHRETGDQLVISYMLLPNSTTTCLATYIEQVTNSGLRAEIRRVLASPEGQRAETFGDVIGRTTFADTGKSILQVLHETRKLTPLDIDDVLMTPDSTNTVPLRTVLEALSKLEATTPVERFNPHMHNTGAETNNEQIAIARNLLVEAAMLEDDARQKRAHAYSIAPSLNPANRVPEEAAETTPPPEE